jgi:hypothetical protein
LEAGLANSKKKDAYYRGSEEILKYTSIYCIFIIAWCSGRSGYNKDTPNPQVAGEHDETVINRLDNCKTKQHYFIKHYKG